MNRCKALFLMTTACGAALLGAPPVRAQDTAQLGEIIVTARKRQESILNVPVVETALPQAQLERLQVQDLKDIATLVPGITLGDSILSIGTQISLRGVGTTTFNPGVDQSVALNIDGLQLTQGLAYSSGSFDMSQVEVLKGPQSLFYGKTSTGGLISIRTADPTDKFEVIARAGYEFEAHEKQGQIIVSGPLTSTLKARIAAQWDDQDGYFNNGVTAGNAALGSRAPSTNGQPDKGYMIRGALLWNPVRQFDARLKVNQVRDRQVEAGAEQYAVCPEGNAPVFGLQFLNPNDNCKIDRTFYSVDYIPSAFPGVTNGGTPFLETTQTYGTLELNYRPRTDLTLTSTTGYYLLHSRSLFNTNQAGSDPSLLAVTNGFHRREVTEEVRANSDFSGPLNFTAGAFVQRAQFSDLVNLIGNIDFGLPAELQQGSQSVDITTNSVFGQLRYRIIPKVELAAGARWTDEKRVDTATDFTTGEPIPVALATPEIHSKKISPEVTLTYTPTSDLTFFGAVKRGFKSGSFDTAIPPSPGQQNAFGDEKVQGGEVGVKSRWLDRRLAFNVAGYNYRYTGLQVGALQPAGANGLPVVRTLNAGSALVYGIEGDIAYRPEWLEGLGLNGSINWNHAQFKSLDNVPCFGGELISQGCNENFSAAANGGLGGYTSQNMSGLPLIRAPKWQANFGVDYETDIGNGMKVGFSSSTQYSSRYLTNVPLPYYQPSFFKTDLSVALHGPRDRWEFALIGKNLTDVLTTGNCGNSNSQGGGGIIPGTQITGTAAGRGPAGIDEIGCWVDRGREVWLRLTIRPMN